MSETPICQSQAILLEKLLVRTQKVSKPNKPMHNNKSNPQSSLTYSPVSKMERAQLIGSEKSLLFVLLLLPPSFGFTNITRCFHHCCVYTIWPRQQSHIYVPCWVFPLMLSPDLCLWLSLSLFPCVYLCNLPNEFQLPNCGILDPFSSPWIETSVFYF
jgi:hypothetical protein